MEAQKTNEEIVEEFDQMMHTGYHKDIKVWMMNILTLKDEAHKKEMEEVVRLANELEHECGLDGDKGTKQWMAFKGFRNTIRDRYITPTKEVTEELPANH